MRGYSLHRRRLNRALRALPPLTGRVLEIGNGRVRRGIDLGAAWTVDIDSTRLPTIQADAAMLPFRDGEFPAVICCEVLQYVAWPFIALRECRRVLMPEGRLILSVPWTLTRDSPADRWRWNQEEIVREVSDAGFGRAVVIRLERWLDFPSGLVVDAVAA